MNVHDTGGQMDQQGDVGREVKKLREARGWSQTRLAVEADMSVSGVSMIESGHRNLTTTTLTKLAKALEVEIWDLFPKVQSPLPLEEILTAAERANIERQARGEAKAEAFFVPLEEGEEEDTVTLRINYVRLMDERDRLLQQVRELERQKADLTKQLEKSGRGPT